MAMKIVGNFLGSLLFGYMHNFCSTKLTLFINLTVALISSIGYYLADYFNSELALWIIIVGRLLEGLRSGGEQSICNSYISEVVDEKVKLKIFSELGMSALAGFLTGGLLGFAISDFEISIFGLRFD